MKTVQILLATALIGVATGVQANETQTQATQNSIDLKARFDQIGSAHPRLGTTSDSLPADMGELEPYLHAVVDAAKALGAKPVLERKMTGRRLLGVSREALRRITVLSAAWLYTKDDATLKRAEAELLAVCTFSDWNPSHYLDTAEMSLAVSIGYDWLYQALPEASREKIAEALWTLGLQTALDESQWWIRTHNNWGQVCHAGMTAAALVLAERHPDEAFYVVDRAFRNIQLSMNSLAPDGIYVEGPGYWDYGTSFNVVFILLAESVLGTSYSLDQLPGFIDSANYMRHVTGPTGRVYNYADGGASPRFAPSLLWFADRYRARFGGHASGAFAREWDLVSVSPKRFTEDRLAALFMLFGIDHTQSASTDWQSGSLDLHGRGEGELILMRSAWNDPDAWYVGIKAGTPNVSHGHMDVGSFILEAGSVRWAIEAGGENYDRLEQLNFPLWSFKQDSQRWDLFRYGTASHNFPVINDGRQDIAAHAKVLELAIDVPSPHVKLDLSSLYGSGRSVARTVDFKNRAALAIEDVFSGLTEDDHVRWQMLTSAAATSRGRVLTLTQSGKSMTLETDADVEWTITETTALYREWDTPQENLRRVSFERKAPASGEIKHRVVFTLL